MVEHLSPRGGQDGGDLDPLFGLEHLTLADDVVPEALARALRTWPFYGVPENPSAWIMRTSRNLALDVVRHVSKWRYGGGRACEAKFALGIEGETSDRNLLHLVE